VAERLHRSAGGGATPASPRSFCGPCGPRVRAPDVVLVGRDQPRPPAQGGPGNRGSIPGAETVPRERPAQREPIPCRCVTVNLCARVSPFRLIGTTSQVKGSFRKGSSQAVSACAGRPWVGDLAIAERPNEWAEATRTGRTGTVSIDSPTSLEVKLALIRMRARPPPRLRSHAEPVRSQAGGDGPQRDTRPQRADLSRP
jgi:hypothetical protein